MANFAATQVVSRQRVVIPSSSGEKLIGILHDTGSKELAILCHGFESTKEDKTIVNLVGELEREEISSTRFDFSGNGESEGPFLYGNYWKEVDDLRAVVLYLSANNYEVKAILGHSKGGNVALLYASLHHDIQLIVNISGRFALERGMEGRLGKGFMKRIKEYGFIDVKDRKGNFAYRVSKENLMDRLSIDMRAACSSISNMCRVLTIHGSRDEIVPVEDAYEFAKCIPNHKLQIIEGANHNYTAHQVNLASLVLEFMKPSLNRRSCNPQNRCSSNL